MHIGKTMPMLCLIMFQSWKSLKRSIPSRVWPMTSFLRHSVCDFHVIVLKGQKKATDLLDLKLQVVVFYLSWMLRLALGVL